MKTLENKTVTLFVALEMEQNQVKALRIASRSRKIDGIVQEAGIVVLRYSDLEKQFATPLHEAAKALGVCTTALKW